MNARSTRWTDLFCRAMASLPCSGSACVAVAKSHARVHRWVLLCFYSASGWFVDALHVSGMLNPKADGISRWARDDGHIHLPAIRSDIPSHEFFLGPGGARAVYTSARRSFIRTALPCPLVSERTFGGNFGVSLELCSSVDEEGLGPEVCEACHMRLYWRVLCECVGGVKGLQANRVCSH